MYGGDTVQDHCQKVVYFYTSSALAGLQIQGSSESQDNPCYVNFLSTQTTNKSSERHRGNISRQKISKIVCIIKGAKGHGVK